MNRRVQTVSRVVPPKIRGEPPSKPPALNTTASHYLADAWSLFAEIYARCGTGTAKFIFQRYISEVEKQENHDQEIAEKKAKRKARSLTTLPTVEQIAAANRKRICMWWVRLPDHIPAREKPRYDLLLKRYIEFGGYPEGFDQNPNLPPLKKRGSVNRHSPNRDLPALFERGMRGGKTRAQVAETLV